MPPFSFPGLSFLVTPLATWTEQSGSFPYNIGVHGEPMKSTTDSGRYIVPHIPGSVIDGQYRQHNPVNPSWGALERMVAHCNIQRSVDSAARLNVPPSVEPVPKFGCMRDAGLDLFLASRQRGSLRTIAGYPTYYITAVDITY